MTQKANFYSGSAGLDRANALRTKPEKIKELLAAKTTRFVPLWDLLVLLRVEASGARAVLFGRDDADGGALIEKALADPNTVPTLLGVGRGGEGAVFSVNLKREGARDEEAPFEFAKARSADWTEEAGGAGYGPAWADLLRLGPLMSASDAGLLAYARGMAAWHRASPFCAACGAPAALEDAGFVRTCTRDAAHKSYPRSDPAVIMLVTCGEFALLGRKAVWPAGRYSCLAGFCEPGESLEEAVSRETEEEAGVLVPPSAVAYHSSQPWPFPASLMLAFSAPLPLPASGELPAITVDQDELEDARWFPRAWLAARIADPKAPAPSPRPAGPDIPNFAVPGPYAIARRLIDSWLELERPSRSASGTGTAAQYSQLLLQLLPRPARRPARCFSFDDSRRRAGPGATCRSACFLARRPAGCFSFVDSRLRAGPSAICRSARFEFPARRPAGCLSFVDSSCPPAWCRRPRRHPTYPPRHPARLARPPALPL
eukprot:tig00000215_g18669.t2